MKIFSTSHYLRMGYLFNGKNCILWPQTILELLAVLHEKITTDIQ